MEINPFVSTFPAPVASDQVGLAAPKIAGYDELVLIGRGGIGKVYRARHAVLGRSVAIKILAHEPDERLLARFAEEARAVARLQHPNICPLFETGTVEGRPYFAQELLEGGSLAEKFNRVPQDPFGAAALVETIANAIQYSHELGILHRDLKPSNIMLAADGTVKVTDFGLAKNFLTSVDDPTREAGLTRTGEIVGTPGYMPPEQASGVVSGLGPATDVYSLGAILYDALTGRPPFQAPDALQTILMVLAMEPVSPRTLQPKVPRDLETICLKCLEKSPKRRYPTARELADDLRRFREGRPIIARPVGLFERTAKWAKRKKAAAALIGLSAVMLVAMVGFGILQTVTATRQREANRQLATAKSKLEESNTELETANANLLAAKKESDASYSLAVEALRNIVERFTNQLFGIPLAEQVMQATMSDSVALYRKLTELRPADRQLSSHYVLALIGKSSLERSYSKNDEAAKTLELADSYLKARLLEEPDQRELLWGKVRLHVERINAYEALGSTTELNVFRKEMIVEIDHFCERFPTDAECQNLKVNRYWTEAALAGDADEYLGRLQAHIKATAAAREYYRTRPDVPSSFILLHSSLYQLGAAYEIRREVAEADKVYAELERLLVPALAANPNRSSLKSELAFAKEARAGIASKLGNLPESDKYYREAEPFRRELILLFPLDPYRKYNLANNLVWQFILERSLDPSDAKRKLDEALVLFKKLAKEFPKNEMFTTQNVKWQAIRQKFDEGK